MRKQVQSWVPEAFEDEQGFHYGSPSAAKTRETSFNS
jgi:hypothetical protein